MTKWFYTFGIVAAATVATAMAQQPGPREGRDGPPPRGEGRQPGGFDGPRFRPLPNPVVAALDADHDGVISADEIKNASAALAKLDKNNDGKLSDEETRPVRQGFAGGPGGPEGRGPAGEERRPGGFEGRGPGGFEGRGPGGEERRPGGPGGPEGRGPDGPPNHEGFLQHALEFDADKDGKLSKDELTKFAEDMQRRRGGPGGVGRGPGGRGPGGFEGRGPGGRGPGGRDPGGPGGGERPQRPE